MQSRCDSDSFSPREKGDLKESVVRGELTTFYDWMPRLLYQRLLSALLLMVAVFGITPAMAQTKDVPPAPAAAAVTTDAFLNSLTEAERAWLHAHPVIRVAHESSWSPIEFTDKRGVPSGMSADYLKLIEQRLGLKFEWISNLSWKEAYARMQRREIDMTPSVSVTPEREAFWAFTKPYMTIPIVIVTREDVTYIADLRELAGKKVAMVDGYATNFWIARDFPEIQQVRVKTIQEALTMLQRGEVFACAENMLVVGHHMAEQKMTDLKIAGTTHYNNAQCMAVRKDWEILAGILDKALDSISETERKTIYDKWLPLHYQQEFDYAMFWKVGAVLVALFLGLVLWNWKLGREIRDRKQAEALLHRTDRALRMISECNQVVVRANSESYLLQAICDIVVNHGGYRMAWIGFAETNEAKSVRPVAHAGFETGYLDTVNITWADTERGRGPSGTAIRTKQPFVARDIPSDPAFGPWREAAIHRGYASSATVPLMSGERAFAALTVYAAEMDAFNAEEVELLTDLAGNLAYGITALRALAEHEEAEHKARQSHDLLTNLAQMMPGVVYQYRIFPDGRSAFPYSSPGIIDIYEVTPAEVREDATPVFERLHPDDYDRVADLIQESARSLQMFYCEFRVILPRQGLRWRWCQARPERMEDGGTLWHGIISDITERKQVEESHARLAMGVEQAAETIIITDTQGTILYANPAFEKTSGYTCAEVIGQNPSVLKSGRQDVAFYRQMWDTIRSGEVWTGHFFNKRKDGTLYEEEATISPIRDAAGTVINFVAVKRDVTYEVELESQLRQSQKMEAIGRMAGGIAHDFNNILSVIFGYSNLLQIELEENPEALAMIAEILKSGHRAKDLVQQILTFSRHREQERQVIHLHAILEETMILLRASLPKNLDIEMNVAADAPAVLANATQIYQVVMNLGTNALHAMEGMSTGRLTITLDAFQPDAECINHHPILRSIKYARLTVSDTGCGMDAKTMERIYDPFFTTKPVSKGTGLGLSVVHGIVEANDGVITVESLPGQGTTFRVYFPEQVQDVSQDGIPEDLVSCGEGQNILMVDDEAGLVEMYQKLLTVLKYEGTVVTSPKEAVHLVRENPTRFDVIVTDLTMPEMSGLEVARQIREIRADLPIILATGFHGAVTDQQLYDAGICEVVEKPISVMALAMVLCSWLGKK